MPSRISDDLTSIATDLAHGLRHYRAGNVDEALWWWQFSYVSSWGNLAGAVLRALLSVVAHDRLDADVDRSTPRPVAAADEMLAGGRRPASADSAGPSQPDGAPDSAERPGHRASRTDTVGIVVQKYGGSSVADATGIKRVAQRIVATRKAGHDVVVVVSAMGDTTDELLDLAEQVSPLPPPRELDMLLTAGERISMALLAMAIANLGHEAQSFTGSQAGVITDSAHGKAKIIDVTPGRIEKAIAEGAIAIVAGFQGVSQDTKDITTLGRGGSDTTAVALAAALGAEVCEIYTDVDGVFTADPRIVPTARKLPHLHRGDARDGGLRGEDPAPAVRRVRPPLRHADPRALVLHQKEGTWVIPTPDRGRQRWNRRSSPGSRTTAARPRSPSSACPTRWVRRPASSMRSRPRRSTST